MQTGPFLPRRYSCLQVIVPRHVIFSASISFTRLARSTLHSFGMHFSTCEMCVKSWDMRILLSLVDQLAGPDGQLPEALQKLDPRTLEMVCSEILDGRSSVQWDDIAGQDQAKRLVQELVVWPMLNPHLFKVSRLRIACNSIPCNKRQCC